MLAAALILAGLFGAPRAAHAQPSVMPSPALEVSGVAEAGTASLDPAFDVSVPAVALARPSESAGAMLVGYAADGRRIFALPIVANGAFHLYVSLATPLQQSLSRVELSTAAARAELVASAAADPAAEIISLDESKAIVAWNAHAFPAVRVRELPDRPPVAVGSGTSTYEQMSLDTHARRVYVEFSDGVHSTTRAFDIFGR